MIYFIIHYSCDWQHRYNIWQGRTFQCWSLEISPVLYDSISVVSSFKYGKVRQYQTDATDEQFSIVNYSHSMSDKTQNGNW